MPNRLDRDELIAKSSRRRQRQFIANYVATIVALACIIGLIFLRNTASIFRLEVDVVAIMLGAGLLIGSGVLMNYYLLRSGYNIFRPYRFYNDDDPSRMLDALLSSEVSRRYGGNDDSEESADVFGDELNILKTLAVERQTYEMKYGQCFETLFDLEKKIRGQIERITRNANLNLIIGILTTVCALSVLGVTVFQVHDFVTSISLMSYYIPRISLTIFMEIFAFFFLRLYRSNLDDIKYFQNEISNLISKIAALKTSLLCGDKDNLAHVIKVLAATERNIVLKEGETTIDLERSRISGLEDSKIIDAVNEFIKKVNRPEVNISKK